MRDGLSSIEWIDRLVGFDTTSRNSNRALIDEVGDALDRHGAQARLTLDDDGAKANLFARFGDPDVPCIILSGHTDVVPVDGQDWSSDPFALTSRDDRLYGRGTCDMKGFLGCVLARVPEIASRQLPIGVAFSYDEEVGCLGVPRLIADVAASGIKTRACIVGEPTEMRVVTGHKGKHSVRCTVRGRESHSALPHLGVNAVEYAVHAISELMRMQDALRADGPFDPSFDPPYTTVHTGTIAGGTALNIVPACCRFDFEFRALPGIDSGVLFTAFERFCRERLEPPMQAVAREAGFAFEHLGIAAPLDPDDGAEIARIAAALTGANGTHRVAFGTEAGLFQQAGIPTVICGPGSIEQAHKPDEFVSLDQVRQCEGFLDRLFDRLDRQG